MKKTKYRIWDQTNKKMLYPDHYEAIHFFSDETCKVTLLPGEEISNIIPMLYIQYEDKTGKEIYEEDITRRINYEEVTLLEIVTYIKGAFCLGSEGGKLVGFEHDKLEIVGNRYESPDLLKVTE